jgi:hypothetical protein
MGVEQLFKWGLTGETIVLGGKLSQCHFVYTFHKIRPGIEPGLFAVESWELITWAITAYSITTYESSAYRDISSYVRNRGDTFMWQPAGAVSCWATLDKHVPKQRQ